MTWPDRWAILYGHAPKGEEVDALQAWLDESFRHAWSPAELEAAIEAHAEAERADGVAKPRPPTGPQIKTLILRARHAKRAASMNPIDTVADQRARLDAIAGSCREQCRRQPLDAAGRETSCYDCEAADGDQAWCIICEPAEVAMRAKLREYCDGKGIRYNRPKMEEVR